MKNFDARGSPSMFLTYNRILDASSTRIPAELLKYFNYQILKSVEHLDAIQFDLLDFLLKEQMKISNCFGDRKRAINTSN